VLTENKD